MLQCRELALAVANKRKFEECCTILLVTKLALLSVQLKLIIVASRLEREIADVRERIKQQRQLQAITHIHLQQSAGKVRSLQKVQPMLQPVSVKSSVETDKARRQHIEVGENRTNLKYP